MANKKTLENKTILVGVTGGIACYKTCEIVRQLRTAGATVHVVMTKSAQQFVTPMTFQALSGNAVHTDLFNLIQESKIGHIGLADQADGVVIAPATANFIAKVVHGLCDDLLSTVVCATKAPVLLAPAMNVNMVQNKIVQNNLALLKKYGFHTIGPAKGKLACGDEGLGRMVEAGEVVKKITETLV